MTDAHTRLASFLQARKLGSTQPNLLAWIAQTAIELEDLELVEEAGHELLALAVAARNEHGDRIDWQDASLRERARSEGLSDADTRRLVHAVSSYAQHTHWGHVALGFAAARRSDTPAAIERLHASIRVRPDPRLRSYGPSFVLARALCVSTPGSRSRVTSRPAKRSGTWKRCARIATR